MRRVELFNMNFTQAEFNEPNVNIKTESRPEDYLFEICGGHVSGGAMEEEYTMIFSDMLLGERNLTPIDLIYYVTDLILDALLLLRV
jgi:hypothetical protein